MGYGITSSYRKLTRSGYGMRSRPMSWEVSLEMSHMGIGSTTGIATVFTATQMLLNPANYDGAVYTFEIVAANNNVSNDYNVDLMQGTNVIATIPVTKNTGSTRRRSVAFVPAAGNLLYQTRVAQTAVINNLTVSAVRIIVTQIRATKTRLQFPLGLTPLSSAADGGASFAVQTNVNFIEATVANNRYQLYQASDFDADTIVWTWETLGSTSGGGATVTIGLFDATLNAQVGTVQNVHPSAAATLSSTISAADMATADGHDLGVRTKGSSAVINEFGYVACLYVTLTKVRRLTLWRRLGTPAAVASSGTAVTHTQLINTTAYSPNAQFFYEGTGWESGAGTVTDGLGEGTADPLAATVVVASSDLTFDGATKIRQRSGALTLTDGNRYTRKSTRTSGTMQIAGPGLTISVNQ